MNIDNKTAAGNMPDEQQFQRLVASVTDYAIYMLDPGGIIISWNAGAQRFKGYAADEVINTHFSRFYTEQDRQDGLPQKALAAAAKVGRFEQEGLRVRKDGSIFWAHVIIDAIRGDHGELIGFAKITRDITEKKEATEALERANAALFQAQKMEAIGQLTGGIAHDFNNLLAVMSGSLEVLSMRLKDQADIKVLETMQRAVERGSTMTQQLLAFARQQPLKIDTYDVNALIAGFEAMLRRAGNAAITFEILLKPGVHPVSLDASRFEASLLNLVVNARDAMPDGGTLTIATDNVVIGDGQAASLPPGAYVKVAVSDTGVGMSPEVVNRAFEPFFTTKEIGKGTGLGLSQVYGFIAQSGGEVTIDSEPGKGTTVSIFLPASNAAPSGKDDAAAETDTVLLVEDEPDLMEVTAELLRSLGYRVLTAGNGADAIAVLKRERHVDILFTDVMMPNGMSGVDVARFTRERHPGVKVILASGYPLPALKARHGNLDEFVFMSKPYRLTELAKRLRTAA